MRFVRGQDDGGSGVLAGNRKNKHVKYNVLTRTQLFLLGPLTLVILMAISWRQNIAMKCRTCFKERRVCGDIVVKSPSKSPRNSLQKSHQNRHENR